MKRRLPAFTPCTTRAPALAEASPSIGVETQGPAAPPSIANGSLGSPDSRGHIVTAQRQIPRVDHHQEMVTTVEPELSGLPRNVTQ